MRKVKYRGVKLNVHYTLTPEYIPEITKIDGPKDFVDSLNDKDLKIIHDKVWAVIQDELFGSLCFDDF